FSGMIGLRDIVYQGTVMTVLAQSSYIAAFSMLIILARLQSFDEVLGEAARDLGATHLQAFWHILLPFLRPALLSAAVLGFLSSFQDYNTTTFAILSDKTLTTVLAARVRMGSSPVVSAVGTGLVMATVTFVLIGVWIRSLSRRRLDSSRLAAAE